MCPAPGLQCAWSRALPPPGQPWEVPPELQTPARACGTFPEPRGGRAGWVGEGLANCRGGCQAPRLRAGLPAIQLSRPSPISRALSSPGASGPMGSEKGGAVGCGRANERSGSSEGGGTWLKGPPRPVPAEGVGVGLLAWPAQAGGRTRGAPGPWVWVRGTRGRQGAKVSRAGSTRGSRDGTAGCHGHCGVGRVAHARGGLRGARALKGQGLACLWWGSSPCITLSRVP